MISSRAVLISSSLRPSRPACHPGLSSRFVVSPGLPVPRLVSRSIVPLGPSRHLVLLSCHFYRYPVGFCPNSWRRRERQWEVAACGLFFFSCAVFLSSLSFASSLGSPRRGVGSFPFPTVAASAWVPHHLIRSVHLIRPHCPIISSHHGTEALVSVVCEASNDGMAVSSAHHLIPSSSWSVSPVISSHASRRASRPHIPGHQRGRDEGRSKQTNTQERGGTGTRNRGARRGEEQKRERQYNGDGTRTEQERQASKDNEDMRRNHEQEQDAPHPFSPDPLAAGSRRFAGLILSPAPGAWDGRTAIS